MNNRKLPLNYIYDSQSERASVSTSVKGSITVEAAMAVPVFFFLCFVFFILWKLCLYKTARKFWASVGVVTQEIQDIIGSEIVKVGIGSIEACPFPTIDYAVVVCGRGTTEPPKRRKHLQYQLLPFQLFVTLMLYA